MIVKDEDNILQYIPILYTLVHPNMYQVALQAVAKNLAEIKVAHNAKLYWRRYIDDPHLELGL